MKNYIAGSRREYYQQNKDRIKAAAIARRMAMPKEERSRVAREASKKFREKNRDSYLRICKRSRQKNFQKRKNDPQYRIKHKLSRACVAYQTPGKSGGIRFMELVSGLTRKGFQEMFPKKTGLTFDHKIPFKAFDLTNPSHVVRCCHWSNLRQISLSENASKNGSFEALNVMDLPWIGMEVALEAAAEFIKKKPHNKPHEFCWMI